MTSKTSLSKIAFLSLFLGSILSCQDDNSRLQEMQDKLDSVSMQLEAQQSKYDSLEKRMAASGTMEEVPVYFGKAFDTIKDPEAYISAALKEQREKIPINAVLGGKMEFRLVEVLSEDWVLALYDDGHIQGKSIYKYELQPNGEIRFTEIVSKLPE